jgi:hypothetical protein
MNHYIDFNPYPIREQDQQIHTLVASLRPQEQLRKNRKVHGSSQPGPPDYLPWSSVAGSLLVKRGTLGRLLIAPGYRPRSTSPDSFVQGNLAGGGKTLWILR